MFEDMMVLEFNIWYQERHTGHAVLALITHHMQLPTKF